jgi:hypothetical protein
MVTFWPAIVSSIWPLSDRDDVLQVGPDPGEGMIGDVGAHQVFFPGEQLFAPALGHRGQVGGKAGAGDKRRQVKHGILLDGAVGLLADADHAVQDGQ